MIVDAQTIIAFMGTSGLAGLGAWMAKGYATKRTHDSKDHAVDASTASTTLATMVRLLEREQDAHTHTRDRLSACNTEVDLRGAQVGDLGARVEMLEARDIEREKRMAKLDERNDACERQNAELTRRVHSLERKTTPHGGTEAVTGTTYREVPDGR